MIQAIKEPVQDEVAIMEVLSEVFKAKELVTYLRQSGKKNELSKSVIQECATRWNSLSMLVERLADMYDEVSLWGVK